VSVEQLAAGVRRGERRAIGRALTLVEGLGAEADTLLAALGPPPSGARRVAITGAGGVGKSTLIAALAGHLRAEGRTVAVLGVDPSSPLSGGAVLGDRVRMTEHDTDEGVFVRSQAGRGASGAIAAATVCSAWVLAAAGHDVTLVETAGAGQDEVAVAGVADLVVLALAPGAGDAVQALKAGIMEVPDVIAVTRADAPGAELVVADLRLAGVDCPVVSTEAPRGHGVAELWAEVTARLDRLAANGELERRQRAGMADQLRALAIARMASRLPGRGDLEALADEVMAGRRGLSAAVEVAVARAEGPGG